MIARSRRSGRPRTLATTQKNRDGTHLANLERGNAAEIVDLEALGFMSPAGVGKPAAWPKEARSRLYGDTEHSERSPFVGMDHIHSLERVPCVSRDPHGIEEECIPTAQASRIRIRLDDFARIEKVASLWNYGV